MQISNKNDVMVSVLCITYNHEQFIEDAIKGIIEQQTNFKYELIIHDDASTDKTAEIIRTYANKYPEIIKPIYQSENKNNKIFAKYMFPRASGKYIALCEGDDYWTDNQKLQKQIDFLEAHEEYSMCMHNAVKLNYATGERQILNTFKRTGTYSQREQITVGLGTDFPATASYVFRRDILNDIPSFFLQASVLDYPLRVYCALKGKIYYFEEVMSVYRIATPQSYMKTIAKNQNYYTEYTLGMIRFYEELNAYTKGQYDDILACKIWSDYMGFCTSTDKKSGILKAEKMGLDLRKIKACYASFSSKHMECILSKLKKQNKHLFVYGTSRLSEICKKQLDQLGVMFDGFVISDGRMKMEKWEEKMVYYLSEVLEQYPDARFILAIQPINAQIITNILKQKKISNYCEPYSLAEVKKLEYVMLNSLKTKEDEMEYGR